ncbi:hypothetical protein [Plantactinospora sp. KBS50]|uniref:hypothetical protein n=1 Tax=Plantactinospora sp. KBS50 TaxID=2024580 RepID=UPI000BAAD61A|nr:hypothetical protein [Plantactinospora sp. KBS50]ASW57343.1 hypothetical protein CIK06_01380 [Plantactinospora sp. KBS50]
MSDNPLIAQAQSSTTWSTGLGLVEDARQVSAGIRDNSWVDVTLGGVGSSLDALVLAVDPLGSLFAWGVGWLMEHLKPLRDALDWLAGQPDEIAAHAATWRNVSAAAAQAHEQYAADARAQTAYWYGASGDAYRARAGDQLAAVEGTATVTNAISYAVEGAGLLVGLVREIVRDLIAQFVATLAVRLPQWLAAEGVTLGLATPAVAGQVATLVSQWANRIQHFIRALLNSLRRLSGKLDELASILARLKQTLARLSGTNAANITADGAAIPTVRFHGGHSTRPRSMLDIERQDEWAGDAYESIRAEPDVDVVASSVQDSDRLDGSIGFSTAEIERIRQHVFFEEHPLTDYQTGGIVHRRYDPSPDIAEAWLRLRAGRPLPEDVVLLEHELAEARYYDAHPGATYSEAHHAANAVSNWQNQIPEPTYEDFSTPWR